MAFTKSIKRFINTEKAAVLVEFALIVPILVLVALIVTQVWHYSYALQKINKAAYRIGDLAAEFEDATEQDVAQTMQLISHIISPIGFDNATDGLIITAVNREMGSDQGTIAWQRNIGSISSKIGTEGGVANFQDLVGFDYVAGSGSASPGMLEGEGVYVIEVTYQYNPMFDVGGVFSLFQDDGKIVFRSHAITKNRFGFLIRDLL